jgi:hypothetical protein
LREFQGHERGKEKKEKKIIAAQSNLFREHAPHHQKENDTLSWMEDFGNQTAPHVPLEWRGGDLIIYNF